MPELELITGGRSHAGWKRISVQLGMEEAAGAFALGVSERWSDTLAPLEVRTQDRCEIRIDGEPIITGAIDAVENGVDGGHEVVLTGRDAAADRVDSAAIHAKGEWRNAGLGQIVRDLAAPFAIPVRVAGDLGAPFATFAIEPGETAFECIERAARQRGVRLVSDGVGGVVIGAMPAAVPGVALVEGDNLLRFSSRNDASQRYSHYIVQGQRAGDDQTHGEAVAAIKAQARDPGVRRYRPLLILDEEQGDIASFQRRAQWEANVRAARALTVDCTVQGWTHTSGLWRPNTLVRFTSTTLRLDRELLVRDVEFVVDSAGTTTRLVLTPAEAYTLQPVAPKRPAPKRRARKPAERPEDAFA